MTSTCDRGRSVNTRFATLIKNCRVLFSLAASSVALSRLPSRPAWAVRSSVETTRSSAAAATRFHTGSSTFVA